ncbi:MAG TPA: class I SAM-dependent methyltransferase [Gaiellaceae bacterium]|nr:class I SAM-dependent methyltransferase [Gaiellaceae bacterium]
MRRLAFRRSPSEYDETFMDTMASEYLEQTPWTELRLGALRELVEPAAGDRIVDLGCAAGALTHYFSGFGATVVGVDSEERAIVRARSLFPELEFEQASVAELPFAAASFDKAVAGDLVEHLDDSTFRAMLGELQRVLVPGGSLSIYTPNPLHLIERLKARNLVLAQNPTHIGLRTAAELVGVLQACGFVVERSAWKASFFRVLKPVEKVLGRRFQTFRYRLCLRARTPG